MNEKVGLIILDGWGIGKADHSDAIHKAQTPFFDSLMNDYPNSKLKTFGKSVGLPEGQMGNSEVGHLNIGAGRIVYQELSRINNAIENGDFKKNPKLIQAFTKAKQNGKKTHLIGLVSDGGVHSSQEHLHALCDLSNSLNMDDVFIHAFTDGRDCDPKSGLSFIETLQKITHQNNIKIASVIGRYYAMDRDQRWERIKKAYDLMTKGIGSAFMTAADAIQSSYQNNISDEFIEPSLIDEQGLIEDGDTVICFNFRSDRPREITSALTQKDFPEFEMKKLNLNFYCMTRYDESFEGLEVIFDKENLTNTLGEVLSSHGKTQLRIAETEKYPHVTFFFNGGREKPFSGEQRILVNSPKVATYDLQPEMSAHSVTQNVLDDISNNSPDFLCLNFANPDMVGHTGVFDAIIKAVETVDYCLEKIVKKGLEKDYIFIVIADHGNADLAVNPDGSPNTAHSLNPVPCVLVSNSPMRTLKDGVLGDIAPTILSLYGIESPKEMTGDSLV
ncbi:2,3-bisphosphoglycerate-independent phosphoglycerate mutase [Crocinitomicaceae bacterium]|nr:2,3-bisphosphoglycerate-independent phosphoglycerate mutase [Crocinitomicaceae bacterium]